MTDYKTLLLLASEMLSLADNEFSNHGCNDLNKKVINMIPQSLCDEMREWNSKGKDPYPEKPDIVQDSFLMAYLADKLKDVAKEFDRDIKIEKILDENSK